MHAARELGLLGSRLIQEQWKIESQVCFLRSVDKTIDGRNAKPQGSENKVSRTFLC